MLKRLKQAWKQDRLGVLGVGSAVVAFVLWALPHQVSERCCRPELFTLERLPAIVAFLVLAVILLLLRRR